MEINYPNQCIVCKSKNKLRCTGCNMVSYCGRDHQLQHWSIHKNFCRTITKILKEKNLSHIYENLNQSTWFNERDRIIQQVRKKLKQSLTEEECFLLKSPRICFICRQAKQELLKNCPNCPTATFCKFHKNSYIHNRNCSIMQNRFDLITRKMNFDSQALQSLIKSIGTDTKILHSNNQKNHPKTMREFFKNYTKSTIKEFSEIQKIFLSETFTISLTIYSILQMLYDYLPSEIIIHLNVNKSSSAIFVANYWESFLHLMADVKNLKIVYIEERKEHREIIPLCCDCQSKKRQLTIEANSLNYEQYTKGKNYQKPNLIAYFNINHPNSPEIGYVNTINKLNEINCPMLLTFLTEMEFSLMRKNLINSSINYSIIYNGYNDFSSLMFHHEQSDDSLNRSSQFLIVFKDERSNFPVSSVKEYWSRSACFYPTICHVCREINPKITCNRCGMINYCSDRHRNRDWIHHRDICEAICSLMSDMKVENIFQGAIKFDNFDSWLQRRIEILQEVQMRIGRNLEEFERQMFLFPKNCAICHDNDPDVLIICQCGANLCRLHQKHPEHEKLCKELSIAFQLATLKEKPSLRSILSSSLDSRHELPSSMGNFLKNFGKPSTESNENNSKDLITSDFLTSSLTLNYVIHQKFINLMNNSLIVIHVIGSTRADLLARSSWKLLLYRLENLKTLKVIFIGMEIPEWSETIVDTTDFSQIAVKTLKVESHAIRYDKYQLSKQFVKPNVIFGCNLNIHECNITMMDYFWNQTIFAMGKSNVPIILTTGSEERTVRENKMISGIFNFSPLVIKNPFASLTPERDFESDGIMYCNSFVTIFNGTYRLGNILPSEIMEKSFLNVKLQQRENYFKSRETISGTVIQNGKNNNNLKDRNEECKRRVISSKIEGTVEKLSERNNEIENGTRQVTSISCENLSNQRLNDSESFLIKRNSFLKSENEILRQQLDLAIAEIARLEEKISEFQKSGNNVENIV